MLNRRYEIGRVRQVAHIVEGSLRGKAWKIESCRGGRTEPEVESYPRGAPPQLCQYTVHVPLLSGKGLSSHQHLPAGEPHG